MRGMTSKLSLESRVERQLPVTKWTQCNAPHATQHLHATATAIRLAWLNCSDICAPGLGLQPCDCGSYSRCLDPASSWRRALAQPLRRGPDPRNLAGVAPATPGPAAPCAVGEKVG